jgi:hypothetical protein
MEVLRKRCSEEENYNITPLELEAAVRECFELNTFTTRSKAYLYFIKGIEREIVDPDVLLSVAIAECKANADLSLLAIALRYGANANLYVSTPTIGIAHVLIYTVSMMRDNGQSQGMINSACVILVAMGSRTVSPAFDHTANRLQEQKERATFDTSFVAMTAGKQSPSHSDPEGFATAQRQIKMTVQDWLNSQRFPDYSNADEVIESLPVEAKRIIGVVCDKPTIAFQEEPEEEKTKITIPAIEDLLTSRALKVTEKIPFPMTSKARGELNGEVLAISKAIDVGASLIFKTLVEKGFEVTYFSLNRLCLLFEQTVHEGDMVMVQELKQMLMTTVTYGFSMDLEQLRIISSADQEFAAKIIDSYGAPYWKKVCFGAMSSPVPDTLKSMAFALGLDIGVSKETLCQELRKLSQADPEAIKDAAIARQRARVSSAVSNLHDYIAGTAPTIACTNKTPMQEDPFLYNDAQMAFYKDQRDHVWCFTSDTYQALLAKPINPYTKEPLPETFQTQLRSQIETLRLLGIPMANPKSAAAALDSLKKPDELSNTESDFIVQTIVKAAAASALTEEKLRTLSPSQMNSVLKGIEMTQGYLAALSPNHQFITFCRAAYASIKVEPGRARNFFNSVLSYKMNEVPKPISIAPVTQRPTIKRDEPMSIPQLPAEFHFLQKPEGFDRVTAGMEAEIVAPSQEFQDPASVSAIKPATVEVPLEMKSPKGLSRTALLRP